tara:strand:+ start:29 stop:2497 length:2469 start_codon:yes stop_codon:yes gene_type:complete
MRTLLTLALFILSFQSLIAQNIFKAKVINAENGEPLAYASVIIGDKSEIQTNIDGSFELSYTSADTIIQISYVGFITKRISISPNVSFTIIKLEPIADALDAVLLYSKENPADRLIQKAIDNKPKNDPEEALNSFKYKSYNKFLIDNQKNGLRVSADTSNSAIETIVNEGRAYLSERISTHLFSKPNSKKEIVEAIKTAGFKKPVYEVLALKAQALSLYNNDYKIFDTDYAGPLANAAFRNYTYKILDTTSIDNRPSYVIYFKPKREKKVAGLEGVLYLDTITFAIQRAKAQLIGAIDLEVKHNYKYYKEEDLWFPSNQSLRIKPGTGGKDISVFGGSISLGTVQRNKSILNGVIASGEVEDNLFLESSTYNYELSFNEKVPVERFSSDVTVSEDANEKSINYWKANRQVPFSQEDFLTEQKVDSIIKSRNIERKIRVKKSISTGYYPVGIWDIDLGNIINYNNYEGLRLGAGGKTNASFSEKVRLNGYLVYGFKDAKFKYGIGAGTLINKRTGTWFDANYSDDIREVASYNYIRGINDFSILEPRYSNISLYYHYRSIQAGLTHRIAPTLDSELILDQSKISQIGNYSFLNNGVLFRDYTISEATLGFLFRPYATFLHTPESHIVLDKGYPQFTGQISKSFSGLLNGDFDFTKVGLKIDYQINRLDLSNTQFILEANYAFGDLPLTHAFHAFPNNPNKPEILSRFSVAGKTAFETMYFNEFFSDRQAALFIRHQLSPFKISDSFRPELVLVNRFVIGDFSNMEAHQNIQFKSLKHGFSEAGLELNKIYAGFGLSFAYRYGAYHLPTFKENFAFKLTFQLKI